MKLHSCSVCGRVGPWVEGSWEWYGSLMLVDWEPQAIVVTCGPVCRALPEMRSLKKEADRVNAKALAEMRRQDRLRDSDPNRGYY